MYMYMYKGEQSLVYENPNNENLLLIECFTNIVNNNHISHASKNWIILVWIILLPFIFVALSVMITLAATGA